MKGLTLEIKFNNGRWLVNGKRLQDLSDTEKDFMNDFFNEVKADQLIPQTV